MAQFTIIISTEEEKALLTDMLSIQDWIDNAIHNKARQCIDKIVEEVSDKQPRKLSIKEKFQIIESTQIESATERNARIETER